MKSIRPYNAWMREDPIGGVSEALGSEAADAARRTGRSMDLSDAVAYMLRVLDELTTGLSEAPVSQ
jgi:hypothetical protein